MSAPTFKRRSIVLSDTSAHTLGLGSAYGEVVGYNVFSSADTTVSLACVDANGDTVLTVAAGDFTQTTGKDGVSFQLVAESSATEDGTAGTPNTNGQGPIAKSPLTLTATGLGSGALTVEVYVRTNVKKRSTFEVTAAQDVSLGAPYANVLAYDIKSSADTTVSWAVVDDDGETIATVASSDFTTRVRKNLKAEGPAGVGVTEDGTDATANSGKRGVWAKSPLTCTPSGVSTGTARLDIYVEG